MKLLFYCSLGLGLTLLVYIYGLNFNTLSETELVNSVLYWYIPTIFGLYGLAANRIKSGIEVDVSAISHVIKGADKKLSILAIILAAISGVAGIIFFFLPLAILKPQSTAYELKVALTGVVFWLVGLFIFFVAIWPSL